MIDSRLLLISRDDILEVADSKDGAKLFRLLARLTRQGFQLLSTAPQPDRWTREHGGPDDALLGPDSIRKRLLDAGGVLDGVYYVPRSSWTQRRNREQALHDIIDRYATTARNCYLFSSSKKFVRVASGEGIHAKFLDRHTSLISELKNLAKQSESGSSADT